MEIASFADPKWADHCARGFQVGLGRNVRYRVAPIPCLDKNYTLYGIQVKMGFFSGWEWVYRD